MHVQLHSYSVHGLAALMHVHPTGGDSSDVGAVAMGGTIDHSYCARTRGASRDSGRSDRAARALKVPPREGVRSSI